MTVTNFVDQLKKIHGSNLISIVLYGSATGENFQNKVSDYNLLLVLQDLSVEEIVRGSKIAKNWVRKNNPPPLYVDKEYLHTSHDVFPMEFIDMQENHQILYGEDPFSGMPISNEHLRLECESELKAQILGIREFVLLNPSRRKIRNLLLKNLSSFFVILKTVLRLKGETIPTSHREILKKIDTALHFETHTLGLLLAAREGSQKIARKDVFAVLESYLTTLKKLSRVIDLSF